jgi:lactoylglutathione lyase
MSFSVTHLDVINLFADDLDRTKAFYQDVLGLTLVFEDASHNVFKLENLIINLIDLGAAHELISPASVADSNSGTSAVLSVFVDDVDAVCAELADRGVKLMNGPFDRPWGVRTASFTDPAGHIWEVGQNLD